MSNSRDDFRFADEREAFYSDWAGRVDGRHKSARCSFRAHIDSAISGSSLAPEERALILVRAATELIAVTAARRQRANFLTWRDIENARNWPREYACDCTGDNEAGEITESD